MQSGLISGTWAVMPIKRLDHAKSRLADLLAPAGRQDLSWAMFCDVFDMLGRVNGLGGILVVTGDAQIARYARRYGAVTLPDPAQAGINQAVRKGLDWLDTRGADGAVIVPGDIPFASPEEIEGVLTAMQHSPAVLVPAVRDGGTNLLGMTPPLAMPVSYGENSFAQHLQAAREYGLEADVLWLDGAARDLDTSADLNFDTGAATAARTRMTLRRMRRPVSRPDRLFCKEVMQP